MNERDERLRIVVDGAIYIGMVDPPEVFVTLPADADMTQT